MNMHSINIEKETTKDCPILYRMRNRPMSETTMCWGWEHDHGWDESVSRMSRQLETLNMIFYPKYRTRIQMDQIKEKFGLLTIYYSVVVDPNKIVTWIADKLDSIHAKYSNLNKYDYKLKRVVDLEAFDYDDIRELSEEDYKDRANDKHKCSNVEYKEENGKHLEIVHLRNYGKSHVEPTKLKLLYHFKELCKKVSNIFMYSFPKRDNRDVRNAIAYLDSRAREIISKAEHECEKTCEICGSQIGTEWSPTCETTSWITYICDRCAKESGSKYYMNGKLMCKGEEVNDGK